MARRRKSSGSGGEGTWLNTYSDMVTLLLTFFAVLLGMSTINEEKFNAIMETFQSQETQVEAVAGQSTQEEQATGNTDQSSQIENMDELYQYLKNYVEQSEKQDAVEVSKEGDVVYIRFSSDLFFLPNQYELLSDSYPTLEFIGQGLKSCENIVRMVTITGHTAAVAGESDISDWRLSGERAATVAIYLEETIGFDPSKLKVEGYGKQYPIADNSTEEGRRKNRRVELVVIGKDQTLTDPNAYSGMDGLYNEELYPAEGGANDFLTPPMKASAAVQQTPSEENETGVQDVPSE